MPHWQPSVNTPAQPGVGVALALVATPRSMVHSIVAAIAALWVCQAGETPALANQDDLGSLVRGGYARAGVL